MQLVGGGAVIFEIARDRDRVGARLFHRLAGVAGFEQRQFVDVVLDEAAELAEQTSALGRVEAAPGAASNARRAAATARSTSALSPAAIEPNTAPSAGAITGKDLPEAEGRQELSMKTPLAAGMAMGWLMGESSCRALYAVSRLDGRRGRARRDWSAMETG